MKKLITAIALTVLFVSCKDNGGSITTSSVKKLDNDDQKAGYAYGMNVADQIERYAITLSADDQLNYKELEKGINDYFKMNEKSRISYATGQNIGQSIDNFLKSSSLDGIVDRNLIVQGLMDKLNKKDVLFPMDSVNDFMTNYMRNAAEKVQEKNMEESVKFLEKKKGEKNVVATESGLLYEVLTEGTGANPVDGSVVEVFYTGKNMDGSVFDESKEDPVKFNLNGVIKGWQEGLKLMKVGSKYRFYIPSELAYGEYGSPDGKIKPNHALIFDVELISTEEAPQMEMPRQMEIAPGN